MNQAEILEGVATGQGAFTWVPLAEGVEVMARPLQLGGSLPGVTARTASRCAVALSRDGWVVSLTTPKVEDLIWEHAALRPEPVLINPSQLNIASDAAIERHSSKMLAKLAGVPQGVLIACGKSWVLSNVLLQRAGRAANYGLFSTSAPHRSATGRFRLWQPLSTAHNLDHFDYSQVLRLVRRRPGTALPSYDTPLSVFELEHGGSVPPNAPAPTPAPDVAEPEPVANGTLGERCIAWCLAEAELHQHPNAERIRFYHAVAMRNGKPLGITTGNHCASAQSRALVECALPGEVRPHEPRAAAIELQSDAVRAGRWRSVKEVQGGAWLPRAGDLAIYDRSNPADPKTAWQRHVDRVIRVSDDETRFENIGANEIAGAWNREWTSFEHPRLLGFVEYPGAPAGPAERALAGLILSDEDAG